MANDRTLDFKKNGHLLITIDDKTYDCRRPKSGEYLNFQDVLLDLSNELNPDEATDATDIIVEQTLEERKASTRAAVKGYTEWFIEVIHVLADSEADLAWEDMPTDLYGNTANEVIMFWQGVPLALPGR